MSSPPEPPPAPPPSPRRPLTRVRPDQVPSLTVVEAALDRADESYRERANSLDTKAGLILSAAGVIVALVGPHAAVAELIGQLLAIGAGGAAVATILPRVDKALNVRNLSDQFLQSDEYATRVLLVNTRLALQDGNERHLFTKVRRLKPAIWGLLASAAAIGIGGIVDAVHH